ncbi:Hypothetical predicted protein [Paramuricea clavata]|uniref:Uncharacterized protein n=1 Tax=Paramuricea clavata TaxID=317549 RepID=A0A7D9JBH2_PARCT|nr:Hypothetical predicted protein [Paramuricea clavata]
MASKKKLVVIAAMLLPEEDDEEVKEKKHHRFNGSLLVRLRAFSGPGCVLHCLHNECCRSVNYWKTGMSSAETENCELLHVLATDHPEYLIEDINYDYYILVQPVRPRNCNCLTCDGGTFCLNEKCSCTYDNNGRRQCTDGNFKIFVSSAGKGYVNPDDHQHAIIKINGTDYSQSKRGFNFVVVDGENGYVEQKISFDTHGDQSQVQMMIEFLYETKSKMK